MDINYTLLMKISLRFSLALSVTRFCPTTWGIHAGNSLSVTIADSLEEFLFVLFCHRFKARFLETSHSHIIFTLFLLGLGLWASTVLWEDLSEVNECVLLVPLARLGRYGVWVFHVIATEVITVVHVLRSVMRNAIRRVLILRLEDDAVVSVIKLKLLNAGLQSKDWSTWHASMAAACASRSDMEELLHMGPDDGPLLVHLGLLVAAKIVTTEHNLLGVLHFLGERRINEEDWGEELLVFRINRFHARSLFVIVSLRDNSEDAVLHSLCCLTLSKRNELITHAEIRLLHRSHLTLAEGGSEIGELSSKIIIILVRVKVGGSALGAAEVDRATVGSSEGSNSVTSELVLKGDISGHHDSGEGFRIDCHGDGRY